ncbi:Glutathione hydrolase 1 proenzyme [Holothuria leucospilota]|uniref:Glutathione hydrolase 1 proenzyme n=1 Tax=Holothuria leucospilota TaxID=206669 RepID=A0A9Q0YGM5_HOLLE|nr:Glutathione hydrolase 1 proenzyme [Holothuria leucospilota]
MSSSSKQYVYQPLSSDTQEGASTSTMSDKAQLVTEDGNKKENEPLQDTTYVREQICGFDGLKFIIVTSLLFALVVTIGMVISIVFGPPQIQPYGAVSTDAEICSKTGADILNRGGSAVDAGIAAMLCLGVVHSHASGIGGGGFMIIGNPKDQKKRAINFREMSPQSTTADMFASDPRADIKGGRAVAVPGEIAGFRTAWEKHGQLKWRELFEPSIQLARYGFLVTEAFADAVSKVNISQLPINMKELVAPNNRPVQVDDILYRSEYADLLERISRMTETSTVLQQINEEIMNYVNENGGSMSSFDFDMYEAEPMEVYNITYHGQDLYTTGAPSNGPLVLMTLRIMENYNYTEVNATDKLYFHRFVEASKYAEAYATSLGDPNIDPEIGNFTVKMISNVTAQDIRKNISAKSVHNVADYYPGEVHTPVSSYGGAQVLAMSSTGTMVAISSSINTPFGARLMTPSGIILNNAMANFDWEGKTDNEPSPTNLLGPVQRPQADLAPLLSWNVSNFCTKRFGIGGVSGISTNREGSRASVGVAQVAHRILMGYNLSMAVTKPVRVFNPLVPDILEIETGVNNQTIAKFEEMDVSVMKELHGLSIVHGMMKVKDQLYVQADRRRLGAKGVKFGRP